MVRKMANSLPNDILFIVCSQLSQQRDFHTLLQCALTGKQLATPALTLLYRYVPLLLLARISEVKIYIGCMRSLL